MGKAHILQKVENLYQDIVLPTKETQTSIHIGISWVHQNKTPEANLQLQKIIVNPFKHSTILFIYFFDKVKVY